MERQQKRWRNGGDMERKGGRGETKRRDLPALCREVEEDFRWMSPTPLKPHDQMIFHESEDCSTWTGRINMRVVCEL
ncbi:hypothetical protein CgunFtcFv8_016885 [Champsocephalus gunnari]|uniref:Uncharacterized protein n=1 Tax=Champsocephalus gunnari TaxID=52237 RepID=A0AAN8CRG6_CHAGU|nr:hypothetical protein CgunFtcFv8_016885 [Champsocephalus gunnari]